ncbi:MAG: zinc-ribbon domain-containing protein [Anaerovoracaceae bacterium]
MRCENCGRENSNTNKFCEYCGMELFHKDSSEKNNRLEGESDVNKDTDDTTGKKKKKKIIICVITGIILAALAVGAAIMYFNQQSNEDYDEAVEKADSFMEKQEYEEAEKAYLDAVDINPEKAYPYIKLADIYLVDERYEDANEILIQGQERAGGKKIDEKLEEIQPYILYGDYMENVVIPEEGLVETDKEISYASMRAGLMSSLIEDFDKDDTPDLLTVSYGDSTSTAIILKLYTVDGGTVELVDEVEREYHDGGDYISADASRFDVFLKEFDDKNFLVISGEILKSEDSEWNGYGIVEIFRLADVIEQVSDAEWDLEPEKVSYLVNDNEVAYYSSYTSVEHDQSQYNSEISIGVKAVTDEMSLFGFESSRVSSACDGLFDMYIKCDEAENERYICHIRHGIYEEDGSVNRTDAGVTRYIVDYTDLHEEKN